MGSFSSGNKKDGLSLLWSTKQWSSRHRVILKNENQALRETEATAVDRSVVQMEITEKTVHGGEGI